MSTVVCLNLVRVALTTLRNMEAEKYSHPLYTYYMQCYVWGALAEFSDGVWNFAGRGWL